MRSRLRKKSGNNPFPIATNKIKYLESTLTRKRKTCMIKKLCFFKRKL